MTWSEAITCLVQQAKQDGVTIEPTLPLEGVGPAPKLRELARVVAWLRERAGLAGVDVDQVIHRAVIAPPLLTLAEQELLRHVGSLVWTGDRHYCFGRLEGVLPGLCLVTPNPRPLLPSDPVQRFRARVERALPFTSNQVEASQPLPIRKETHYDS